MHFEGMGIYSGLFILYVSNVQSKIHEETNVVYDYDNVCFSNPIIKLIRLLLNEISEKYNNRTASPNENFMYHLES